MSRLETNLTVPSRWLAYARRRAGSLRPRVKARHTVHSGLLMRFTRRGRHTKAQVLDLPHYLVFLVAREWPVDHRFIRPRFVKVAATRSAFINGTTISEVTEDYLSEDSEGESGTEYRDTTLYPIGDPVRFTYLTSVAEASTFFDSMSATGVLTDDGGYEGTPGTVILMPMSPARPLSINTTVVGHWKNPVEVALSEATVGALTGGGFIPRGLADSSDVSAPATQLPLQIPEPSSTFNSEKISLVCPLVHSTGGERDYGTRSLFLMRVPVNPQDAGVAEGSMYTHVLLPSTPQFDLHEWPDPDDDGYVPSFLVGALTQVGAADVYYGMYHAGVVPTGGTGNDEVEYITTLFRVRVEEDFTTTWSLLRCGVSDPSIADRAVNATSDVADRNLYWYPAAFTAAGSTWGVFLSYHTTTGRLTGGSTGSLVTTDNMFVTVFRDDTVVAEGIPTGTVYAPGFPGEVRLFPQTFNGISVRQTVFACHLSTDNHFGFSFIVVDEVTNRRVLAKWDTLSGFGVWDIDLGPLGEKEADSVIPALTCFRRVDLDEDDNIVGDPGFICMASDEAEPATYVITAGQTFFVSPTITGAALPVGNALTARGSTSDAYQLYTAPEED